MAKMILWRMWKKHPHYDPDPVRVKQKTRKWFVDEYGQRNAFNTKDWEMFATEKDAWDALLLELTKDVTRAKKRVKKTEAVLASARRRYRLRKK